MFLLHLDLHQESLIPLLTLFTSLCGRLTHTWPWFHWAGVIFFFQQTQFFTSCSVPESKIHYYWKEFWMSHSRTWQHQRENGRWACQSPGRFTPPPLPEIQKHFKEGSKMKALQIISPGGIKPVSLRLQDSQRALALQNRPVEPAQASTERNKYTQNTCILLCRHSQTELWQNWH